MDKYLRDGWDPVYHIDLFLSRIFPIVDVKRGVSYNASSALIVWP